ncbi:MAG: NADP-dependent malic enzyme [Acidobacteriia bacterium]|nr:NADP-dependent malic enzyme [Terriglobia bacterium]
MTTEPRTPTREELEARASKPDEESLRLHAFYQGKMQVVPKCPISSARDFAYWYTPGVAAPSKAIQADPSRVYELTNKSNLIAVVSDGSRVLGLGNIGPHAGLPVMEGKALLFKYLGGVDAVALCLATQDAREFTRAVQLLEPAFGAINLEDIAQPRCFRVLAELRKTMPIPVWHDDQQGSATALLAGLIGALKVVGKRIDSIRIAMIGMGAANFATYGLLKTYGVDPAQIVACDSRGTLHRGRRDIEDRQTDLAEKWAVCQQSNPDQVTGGIQQVLRGADVCIAFACSNPKLIDPAWIRSMAKDAIVFACANPSPEIWPWDAKAAGARIVATGRSDFPNQLNNSLVFPAIFRGTLDARAVTISDDMALAAAIELARCAEELGLREDAVLPRMTDWQVVPRVAAATAMKAQELGLARVTRTREEYLESATRRILDSQRMLKVLMQEGVIAELPEPAGEIAHQLAQGAKTPVV